MLILGRSVGDVVSITIPPSTKPQTIEIEVTLIRGGLTKLGFTADPAIKIHRREILEVIARGEIKPPEKPPLVPVVRIGDPLPGA